MVQIGWMHRIAPIARILLGLTFLVFSLNYFVPFLPQPTTMPPPSVLQLVGGLSAAGLMTLIKVIELGSAFALLANRGVSLALALLAPIIVGIVAFHVVLMPAGLPVALFVLTLEVLLAWSYRSAFAPMLRARAVPDGVVAMAPAARLDPAALAR
jgi:hypothetical protein